jgi:hypothetical protein
MKRSRKTKKVSDEQSACLALMWRRNSRRGRDQSNLAISVKQENIPLYMLRFVGTLNDFEVLIGKDTLLLDVVKHIR